MNTHRGESTYNAQPETHSNEGDRRPSIDSVCSSTGSSYDTTDQEREELLLQKSPRFSKTSMEDSHMPAEHSDTNPTEPQESDSRQRRSPSTKESSRSANMRRRDKVAVGFACLNCKKAHLACDVSRPCRRCVQMGRASTCADVPHKRRGRPRLRDMQQPQQSATAAVAAAATAAPSPLPTTVSIDPNSPSRSNLASSPIIIRQRPFHSRTGSSYMDNANFPASMSWSSRYQQQQQQEQQHAQQQQQQHVQRYATSPVLSSGHVRQMIMVPLVQGSPDLYRSPSATLLIGPDLKIVRAMPDVQGFFFAPPTAIESRNLADLVHIDDRGRMSGLVQALQDDIRMNRLLFQAHANRQSLVSDLLPYANADLTHPFPGANEHLMGLCFLDAQARPIVARMVVVLGSRSNDRFAYAIVSIQRQEAMPTPPTPLGAASSPRPYDLSASGQVSTSPEFILRHPSNPASPPFPPWQVVGPGSTASGLPRSVPLGYTTPSRLETRIQPTTHAGLGLNVLPGLHKLPGGGAPAPAVDEPSGSGSGTATQSVNTAATRPRGTTATTTTTTTTSSLSKRTSMSLSEMMD